MRNRLRGLGRSATAATALSFLDIVSAGFGGAVFLFVVFASLPIDTRTPATGGGGRFIDVLVEWRRLGAIEDKPVASIKVRDPIVDLHIEYRKPSQPKRVIRLSELAKDIDPKTDIYLVPRHRTGQHSEMPWDWIHVTGFDPFGHYERLDKSNNRHTMHIRVLGPRGGSWRFKAKVYSAQSAPNSGGSTRQRVGQG